MFYPVPRDLLSIMCGSKGGAAAPLFWSILQKINEKNNEMKKVQMHVSNPLFPELGSPFFNFLDLPLCIFKLLFSIHPNQPKVEEILVSVTSCFCISPFRVASGDVTRA